MFLDTLARHSQNYATKTAIAFIGGPAITYGQLDAAVNRSANYLRALGLQPGQRVAAQLPKCLPFIYLHLAAAQMGAIFLPLNPAYPLAELRYFLADSGARLLFADRARQAELQSLPALERTIFIDPTANWPARVADYPPTRDYALPQDPQQTAMML